MKTPRNKEEDLRAQRIYLMIEDNHKSLSVIYEKLVDREFATVEKDIRGVIADLRLIIKSIEDDVF